MISPFSGIKPIAEGISNSFFIATTFKVLPYLRNSLMNNHYTKDNYNEQFFIITL